MHIRCLKIKIDLASGTNNYQLFPYVQYKSLVIFKLLV